MLTFHFMALYLIFMYFFWLVRNAKSFRLETNHQNEFFFYALKKYIYFTNVVSAKKNIILVFTVNITLAFSMYLLQLLIK